MLCYYTVIAVINLGLLDGSVLKDRQLFVMDIFSWKSYGSATKAPDSSALSSNLLYWVRIFSWKSYGSATKDFHSDSNNTLRRYWRSRPLNEGNGSIEPP